MLVLPFLLGIVSFSTDLLLQRPIVGSKVTSNSLWAARRSPHGQLQFLTCPKAHLHHSQWSFLCWISSRMPSDDDENIILYYFNQNCLEPRRASPYDKTARACTWCLLGARSVSWSALMPLTLVDQ